MEPRMREPVLTEYLFQKASRKGIPFSGTFELTPVCNMNCKMCYVRMSKSEQESIRPLRTGKEWIELAKKAKDAGMVYLLLTGGEPFLHPDFPFIMQSLKEMGFVVTINSNGTMIDEKTVEWLKEAPPIRVNITLYGASDETDARLCGNPKGFTKTTKAIQLLREAGIMVRVNCSITPYNKEDIQGIFQFATEKDMPIQVSSYMFPPLRRDASMIGQNKRLTPEEAAYYMAYSEFLLRGREYFLERSSKIPDIVETDDMCMDIGDGMRCRAGRCSFWITWEGEMTACGMFPPKKAPNVFEEGFETSWERVKRETSEIRLPAKCAGCSVKDTCRTCAAMVVTETGAFDKVPVYRCEMMKAYPKQRKKVELLAYAEKIPSDGKDDDIK